MREFDKQLRDYYFIDFKALRHKWEEIYLAALESGQTVAGGNLKKILQVLDRVGEKVNRADYGYAGLWDRKGSIREKKLAHIFDYDKALDKTLQELVEVVEEMYQASEAENWDGLKTRVKNVKSLILGFESKWNEREKEFRPLEV